MKLSKEEADLIEMMARNEGRMSALEPGVRDIAAGLIDKGLAQSEFVIIDSIYHLTRAGWAVSGWETPDTVE